MLVKDPSHALFSKEQNNWFFCKHPRRRLLKEVLHCVPLRDSNHHLLASSHKIWGNAKLVSHRVSEKPNNNYFSINYVKETPLLHHLWKILGMIGKWNSGLCCLTMTAQSTKIWPLRMFVGVYPGNSAQRKEFWSVCRLVCYTKSQTCKASRLVSSNDIWFTIILLTICIVLCLLFMLTNWT